MPPIVQFAVNMRKDTTGASFVQALRPWGWLAAPNNTTAKLRQFVADCVKSGRSFVADNGNFERVGKAKTELAPRVTALHNQVAAIEKTLGRSATRADFPTTLVEDLNSLAEDAARALSAGTYDAVTGLAAQAELQSTHIIGAEDITMATLLALDIERAYLTWPRSRFKTMNRRVARKAASVIKGAQPSFAYYAVASAMDYQTAYDAGREFSRAGLTRVAMGFGAYMSDNNSTDYLVLRRRTIRFGERLPQRYVRTAAVVRGFCDGYSAGAGPSLEAFHFLGLGSPILMGLAALATCDAQLISFDAMSPIKDAVEGTLYVTKPAFLKIRTRKVADRFTRDMKVKWDCPCAFCRSFSSSYPFDALAAQAWRVANPEAKIDAKVLRPGGALFAALPFLSEPIAGPMRQTVSEARMGHNHWILINICKKLQKHLGEGTIESFMKEVVGSYARETAKPHFGRAIQLAYDLASRTISG